MTISTSIDFPRVRVPVEAPDHLASTLAVVELRCVPPSEFGRVRDLVRIGWPGMEIVTGQDYFSGPMSGNPVVGAYDSRGELIGFSRLHWGLDVQGGPLLWSHLTGVHPEARDGGIGELLKWAARAIALHLPATPVEQVQMSFDPFRASASRVNLHKIGVLVGPGRGAFVQDAYADTPGMVTWMGTTDRFVGSWAPSSPRVLAHLRGETTDSPLDRAPFLLRVAEDGWPDLTDPGRVDCVVVEIPSEPVRGAPECAASWRDAFREAVRRTFDRGLTFSDQSVSRERRVVALFATRDPK
jgi:predicted GNAT superfamily acetyltransferase